MPAAALRCGLVVALACAVVSCTHGADAPVRSAPSRPGAAPAVTPRPSPPAAAVGRAVPGRKIGNVDYVSVAHVASNLGLKRTVIDNGDAVELAGAGVKAELEGGTRDVTINGLRVFLGHPTVVHRGQIHVSRIDFERNLAPLLRPGHGVVALPTPRVIVLDPGHGGRDPGKTNSELKINEKTFTLDLAKRLKGMLEAEGYRVVLTREGDTYPELGDRPAIANRAGADLFVSIHFNALENNRRTSGVEIYTFSPQHQRSTEAWMPGQKDDTETTPAPVNEFDYWSALLAQSLQRPFVFDLKASDRGKKTMHAAVLRSLECPGVLIECGFLTSDVEARKVMTPEYRQKMAEALRDGILEYSATVTRARQKAATKSR